MRTTNKLVFYVSTILGSFFYSCSKEDATPIPDPPTNLEAKVVSLSQIDLTWKDNATSETGFKIERKTGSGDYSVIDLLPKDATTYSDKSLAEKTTYSYRLFAFNSAHDSGEYSNEISATTQSLPGLTTTATTTVTPFTATSGGSAIDEGGVAILSKGVVWSTSSGPTVALSTKTSDGLGASSFTSNITGLNWETKYYLRSYATTNNGTGYGNEVTFTTEPLTITTSTASDLTYSSATAGGTINGEGGTSITSRGVVWSTTSLPTVALSTKVVVGAGVGTFNATINSLIPNKTYYVRAFASNSITTTYGNEVSFTSELLRDIDGNTYATVEIGTQVWMAENLRTTKYNDGSGIPFVPDLTTWKSLPTAAYVWVNNDMATDGATYGAMYNWNTVNTGKLCPNGWHVPTVSQVDALVNHLGGEEVAGNKLKESGTLHWVSPNAGTNEIGFTALPAGILYSSGDSFSGFGSVAWWWTSDAGGIHYGIGQAWAYYLKEFNTPKADGRTVRCLK